MNSVRKDLIISAPASSEPAVSLAEQRNKLRQKIRTHREVLEHRLGPDAENETQRAYPRSMIMRFFTQRPGLAVSVLGKIGTLLVGARLVKSTGAAMAVATVVQSMLAKKRP